MSVLTLHLVSIYQGTVPERRSWLRKLFLLKPKQVDKVGHTIPCVSGTWHIGAYVYSQASNAGGGTASLACDCYSDEGSITLVATECELPPVGVWAYMSGTVVVPEGYELLDPVLRLRDVPDDDVLYVDDTLVRRVEEAR